MRHIQPCNHVILDNVKCTYKYMHETTSTPYSMIHYFYDDHLFV